GGISAFHVAALNPQYFLSVTGFPGYLIEATPARVSALSRMCINMHAGELDSGWREDMDAQSRQFRAKGYTVRFTVEKGEGHVMRTLAGSGSARLFNQFEEASQGCVTRTSAGSRAALYAAVGPELSEYEVDVENAKLVKRS